MRRQWKIVLEVIEIILKSRPLLKENEWKDNVLRLDESRRVRAEDLVVLLFDDLKTVHWLAVCYMIEFGSKMEWLEKEEVDRRDFPIQFMSVLPLDVSFPSSSSCALIFVTRH